ncbi:MAG: HindIII family type II restriction endonuclease [Thermoanaerobaculia bacterium]|nr:HindIII family type II restriction endonuclease [Thermoanaerobaculia bacterium]
MTPETRKRRAYWVSELAKLSGSFENDSSRMIEELGAEIASQGSGALLDHLRLCGAVPEQYGHDSSEEKLYSKYTDAIICETFRAIGLKSTIISARADAADVQALSADYSLVADAKAFRLSRTAKNQKDFKIQAMDGWRNDLDHAIVVCPIYQLPRRTSQIYQQAIARKVCILSYSHLAVLLGFAERRGKAKAAKCLGTMLKSLEALHLSKNAVDYWSAVNGSLVTSLKRDGDLWTAEKIASIEALRVAKEESLTYLRAERGRMLGLSHEQALEELIRLSGLDSRIAQVERIEHGRLLGD